MVISRRTWLNSELLTYGRSFCFLEQNFKLLLVDQIPRRSSLGYLRALSLASVTCVAPSLSPCRPADASERVNFNIFCFRIT